MNGNPIRLLLSVLLLLVCSACAATRQASEDLESEVVELRDAMQQLKDATVAGATEEELAALDAKVSAELEDVKDSKDALTEAAQTDLDGRKEAAKGLFGLGMPIEGGALAALLTGASWWMRDKRKKQGQDPLQRLDVATPETTTGPPKVTIS